MKRFVNCHLVFVLFLFGLAFCGRKHIRNGQGVSFLNQPLAYDAFISAGDKKRFDEKEEGFKLSLKEAKEKWRNSEEYHDQISRRYKLIFSVP